jgi:uncharacterized membrane protein
MITTGLVLPIIWHNDDTRTKKDLGIDFKLEDCDTKEIIFYHINAILPSNDDNDEYNYTDIHSNGEYYVCPLPIKEVQQKWEAHLKENSLTFLGYLYEGLEYLKKSVSP